MLLITFRVCGTFLVHSRIYNSFDVRLKTFSQKKITKNPENPELGIPENPELGKLGLVISVAPFEYKTILTYVFTWCTLYLTYITSLF